MDTRLLRRGRPQKPEPQGPPPRWPGATQKFALFGEVLGVGVLVTVGLLPIVTIPATLSAACRHLLRYLRGEQSSLGRALRDFRETLPGGLVVGLCWAVAMAVLLTDAALASSGLLPGGSALLPVMLAATAVLTVVMLRVAQSWEPVGRWRSALKEGWQHARTDLTGSAYLLAAIGIAVLVTWQLPPLIVPALGCLVFAVVAIAIRREERVS